MRPNKTANSSKPHLSFVTGGCPRDHVYAVNRTHQINTTNSVPQSGPPLPRFDKRLLTHDVGRTIVHNVPPPKRLRETPVGSASTISWQDTSIISKTLPNTQITSGRSYPRPTVVQLGPALRRFFVPPSSKPPSSSLRNHTFGASEAMLPRPLVVFEPAPFRITDRMSTSRVLQLNLSSYGTEVASFVDDVPVTGEDHLERRRRVVAAVKLYNSCIQRNFFRSDEIDKNGRIYYIASTYSHGYIDNVRNALDVYYEFIAKRPELVTGASVVTITILCSFLNFKRDCQRRALKANRGLSAPGLLDKLTASNILVCSPFTPDIVSNPIVKAAARPTFSTTAKGESAVSLYLACLVEDCAIAADPVLWAISRHGQPRPIVSKFESDLARDLVVVMHTSVRGISCLRMKVVEFLDGDASLLDGAARIHLSSSGDKASSSAAMHSQEHFCVVRGFTPGFELWANEWAQSKIGSEYFFEGFEAKPSNSVPHATRWTGAVASTDTITGAIRHFASKFPISWDVKDCLKFGLSSRSLRHIIPSLAKVFAVSHYTPSASEFSVGKWKMPLKPSSRRTTPCVYAGTELEHLADAMFILGVVSAVRAWIGDLKAWQNRVPVQRNQHPSFSFLAAICHAESDEDIEEFSSDEES